MKYAQYQRTFSVGEESEAEHGHIDQDQRRRLENYLWWRRSGVLVIILFFFVLTATLLSVSVFYDQTIREIHCKEDDMACMETLCPYGWSYVKHLKKCQQQKGLH